MYANADNIDPRQYHIEYESLDDTDKWLLSKANRLIKDVTTAYDHYNLTEVVNKCVNFLNDDLSNWYIRSNRRRFWESELTISKQAVYQTTYEVLRDLVLVMAPITPFVTEEIYQDLTGEKSVHLADFPHYDPKLINESLETKMDLVRDICSLGRFARDDIKIKVRQPLSAMLFDHKLEKEIKTFEPIIKEELNVKKIEYIKNMSTYMTFEVKPNYRVAGKMFGSQIKDFALLLTSLTHDEIVKLEKETIHTTLAGHDLAITPDMVDIKVHVKEGFCSASNSKVFVILNTELTSDLIKEGIAREIVRKVQTRRKEQDLVITDHILLYYDGNDDIKKTIATYGDFIKGETLANQIINQKLTTEPDDMSFQFEIKRDN